MKNKNFLYLAAFTMFTVLVWIGFDLYHIAVSSTIPEEMQQNVTAFNPALDLKVIQMIKAKKKPADFAEGTGSPSAIIQEEEFEPTPANESTPSAEL